MLRRTLVASLVAALTVHAFACGDAGDAHDAPATNEGGGQDGAARGDGALPPVVGPDGTLLSGTLDPSFGPDRELAAPKGLAGRHMVLLSDVSLSRRILRGGDGSIFLFGVRPLYGPQVHKLTADGLPFPGFGDDLSAIARPNVDNSGVSDFLLQPDGKIVLAGAREGSNLFVMRLTGEGKPDLSFGTAGRVEGNFIAGRVDRVSAATILSDGSIVVTGPAYRDTDAGLEHLIAFAKFDAAGNPVTAFGTNGVKLIEGPADGSSPIRASDGSLVTLTADRRVIRYTADCELDTTFSALGVTVGGAPGDDDRGSVLASSPADDLTVAWGSQAKDATKFSLGATRVVRGALSKSAVVEEPLLDAGGLAELASATVLNQDVLIGGVNSTQPFLARLRNDGSRDTTFEQNLLGPGAPLASMQVNSISTMAADGPDRVLVIAARHRSSPSALLMRVFR